MSDSINSYLGTPLTNIKDGNGELIPHVFSFSQILNTTSKSYSYRWDEAVRHNPDNALAMRRDCYIESLLQERSSPTVNREWQIEVDNLSDPVQKSCASHLKKIVEATPKFRRLLDYLNMEGSWYGRYGSQVVYKQKKILGIDRWCVVKHKPVNGDKIQGAWDDTPAILINPMHAEKFGDSVVTGDRNQMLMLNKRKWRDQFIIHTFRVRDADYFEGEMAGVVQGEGLRSKIYWAWWLRDEMLSWAVDFMKKVGTLGLLIFPFEMSNPTSKSMAEENARKASQSTAIVMPVYADGMRHGMDLKPIHIPASQYGVEALQHMIADYFERHMERLIVGQSMSSGGGGGGGLEGDGRAEFAKDTKFQLLQFDADNLSETLSNDLLGPLMRLNFPQYDFPVKFKLIVPDPDAAGKLQAAKTLVGMGVKVKVDNVLEFAGIEKAEPDDETVGGIEQLYAKHGELKYLTPSGLATSPQPPTTGENGQPETTDGNEPIDGDDTPLHLIGSDSPELFEKRGDTEPAFDRGSAKVPFKYKAGSAWSRPYYDGGVDKSFLRSNRDKMKGMATVAAGSASSFNPSDLHATQEHLVKSKWDGVKSGRGDNDPIIVVRHNGKHYIEDGHHRAAAAMSQGKQINAHVFEIDKDGNPRLVSGGSVPPQAKQSGAQSPPSSAAHPFGPHSDIGRESERQAKLEGMHPEHIHLLAKNYHETTGMHPAAAYRAAIDNFRLGRSTWDGASAAAKPAAGKAPPPPRPPSAGGRGATVVPGVADPKIESKKQPPIVPELVSEGKKPTVADGPSVGGGEAKDWRPTRSGRGEYSPSTGKWRPVGQHFQSERTQDAHAKEANDQKKHRDHHVSNVLEMVRGLRNSPKFMQEAKKHLRLGALVRGESLTTSDLHDLRDELHEVQQSYGKDSYMMTPLVGSINQAVDHHEQHHEAKFRHENFKAPEPAKAQGAPVYSDEDIRRQQEEKANRRKRKPEAAAEPAKPKTLAESAPDRTNTDLDSMMGDLANRPKEPVQPPVKNPTAASPVRKTPVVPETSHHDNAMEVLKNHADMIQQQHNDDADEHNAIIKHVEEHIAGNWARDPQKYPHPAIVRRKMNDGHIEQHDDIPGLDVLAEELANSHFPGRFRGKDGNEHANQLFEMFKEGRKKRMSRSEAEDKALELLEHQHVGASAGKKKADDEEIPFAELEMVDLYELVVA